MEGHCYKRLVIHLFGTRSRHFFLSRLSVEADDIVMHDIDT